ncbi:MAG: response regulator transcription factor [Phycisphaerales bacterium]
MEPTTGNDGVSRTWDRAMRVENASPPSDRGNGLHRREQGLRVVVADDHDALRQCVCRFLTEAPGLEIIGQAANGQEAITLTRELTPDVVLMDVSMPHVNGIEATRQIVRDCPAVRVVAMSATLDRTTVTCMLDAGASGWVSKTGLFNTLLEAIGTVSAGKHYICTEAASVLGNHRTAKEPAE